MSELTVGRRIVVIGAAGFIGSAVMRAAKRVGIDCAGLTRADCDLTAMDADLTLDGYLQPGDIVIAAAAVAPCKDTDMLASNVLIMRSLERALRRGKVAYVINISSDAVYPDHPTPLHEGIPPSPTSLHGAMHLVRETVVSGVGLPTLHLRPTLIYGPGDPHNGYGPNRFARQARNGSPIILFGDGEERRDHVHIDDVAEATVAAASQGLTGALNIACGEVWSFREIAEAIRASAPPCPGLGTTPRIGPPPHGGYRPFDTSYLRSHLPNMHIRTPADGLRTLTSAAPGEGR